MAVVMPGYCQSMRHLIRPELMGKAVEITTLRPHPANPNMGDVDEILASLRRFGQFKPVTVDRRTDYLLAGHHVYYAAMEDGWDLLAVNYVSTVDDVEAMGILLADNGTARRGRDDEGLLLAALQAQPGLEGTGYSRRDVTRLEALLEMPLDLGSQVSMPLSCKACGHPLA